MREPCNVLQSGPRFDFIQPFFLFWNLCSASAIQLPMDLCNAFAIQPISFFRCKSKLSQIELQISNPRFPLFCFSLWATRQRKNYTTALPISQDILQISNAANVVELHASLLVVQDVQPTWPKVRKGNPPGSNNTTSILFVNSISTKASATSNVGK